MKIPYRIRGAELLCLSSLLSLAAVRVHADPVPPANTEKLNQLEAERKATEELNKLLLPTINKGGSPRSKKKDAKEPRSLADVTLNYEGASPYSHEFLDSKVTVKLTQAPFLSALEAIMEAAPKTCRIECRHMLPVRVSLNVKDRPVAGLLDSIATMGSARLYVLPSKLLIAPESQLSDEEKKTAKLYSVLLTAATLPNTPGISALTTGKPNNKSILDFANTKISVDIEERPILTILSPRLKIWGGVKEEWGDTTISVIGPYELKDLVAEVSMNLQDVTYAEAVAALGRMFGCDLYLTPQSFVLCAPENLPKGEVPQNNGKPMFPAFVHPTTSFPDLSAGKS